MFFIKYLILVLNIFFNYYVKSDKLEYYLNKINEHTEHSANFKLPLDNSGFFKNVDYEKIIDYGTFDFIIVGAGATGAVLASRLAENNNWNILLLEAGDEENDITDIPATMLLHQFSEKNWGYLSTPQKTCCLGMKNRQCAQPRGKSIGGSTVLNALMYVRGNKQDYDNWSKMGNKGWSFKDVLPYFIKSEHSQIYDGDARYHGHGGPLNVAYSVPDHDLHKNFIKANHELGLQTVDYNGAKQIGVSRTQFNIKHGKRQSTGRSFLSQNHKNLNITTNSLVTKILIKRSVFTKNKAEGVLFIKNGKIYLTKSKHATIISAGAFNTPQLLMLSGIGPKKDLERLNIKNIVNLPVGKYMKDHTFFTALTFKTNYKIELPTQKELLKQFIEGNGILTKGGNSEALVFLDLDKETKGRPEVELLFIPAPSVHLFSYRMFNFNDTLVKGYLDKIDPESDFAIYVILLHPESEGSITLKSNDPKDFPNIDISQFSDKNTKDLETMYKGIQYVLKLANTTYFRDVDTKLLRLPICKNYKFNSRGYWYCLLKHTSTTIYHPSSTARMGTNRKKSVVNYKLLVHSFENLYIADASVFPTSVSGHNSAPCMMIGEKLAEEIKTRYHDICKLE